MPKIGHEPHSSTPHLDPLCSRHQQCFRRPPSYLRTIALSEQSLALHHSSLATKSTTPGFQPNPSNPFEHPSNHPATRLLIPHPNPHQDKKQNNLNDPPQMYPKIAIPPSPSPSSKPPTSSPPESAMSLNLTSKATFSSLPFAAPAALLRRDQEARFRSLKIVVRDRNHDGSRYHNHNCSRYHYVCGICGKIRWRKLDGDRSVPGCEHVIRVRLVSRGS